MGCLLISARAQLMKLREALLRWPCLTYWAGDSSIIITLPEENDRVDDKLA